MNAEYHVRQLGGLIGDLIEAEFPAVCPPDHDHAIAVPSAHVDEISALITLAVAEMLQAWLDAGSERDVTLEELGPIIRDHVKGWSV